MKKSATTFLTLLYFTATVFASKTLENRYWIPVRIVVAVYNQSDITKSNKIQKEYNKLKSKYPVTFLFKEDRGAELKSYFVENIGGITSRDTIIYNDSLLLELCPDKHSRILVIKSNDVQLEFIFKKIRFALLNYVVSVPSKKVDSFDISAYAGSDRTIFSITKSSNLYIHNDLNRKTYQYNIGLKSIVKKFDFTFLTKLDSQLIYGNVNLTNSEKENNISWHDEITQMVGTRANIKQPFFEKDAVYVPLIFHVKKMMKLRVDSSMALLPSVFIAKVTGEKFKISRIYSLPYQIYGTTLYNDITFVNIIDDKLYINTPSNNSDTTIAVYNFNNFISKPNSYFSIKLPDYFPKRNSIGREIGYKSTFTKFKNDICFIYDTDPVLYFLYTGKKVELLGFDSVKFDLNGKPLYFINIVKEYRNYIVAIVSNMGGLVYSYRYNRKTYELESKMLLSSKPINIIDYEMGNLYWYELGDESATLFSIELKL